MKLTKTQLTVILKLQSGWKLEKNSFDTAFLFKNGLKKTVPWSTLKKLLDIKLIEESTHNPYVKHFHLTESGTSYKTQTA